jgi:hypothetical protein
MRHIARTAATCMLALGATAMATVSPSVLVSTAIATPGIGIDIRDRFNQAFPGGTLIDVRGQLRRVFGQRFSTGATPHDSVESFLLDWSTLWGVPFEQLQPVGPFDDGAHQLELMHEADGTNPSFTAVYWQQHVRGVPVFRSWVWGLVGNQDAFPMMLGGGTLKDLGDEFPASLEGRDLSPSTMDPAIYAREAMNQFGAPPQMTSPRYVIWAGIDTDAPPARLGIEFVATGGGPWDPSSHRKMQYVVDADTGEVLHQESLILHGAVTGTVSGKVTDGSKADACNAEVTKGLPYATVVVGGTSNFADANGAFSATYTGTASVSVAPTLAGRFFRVIDAGGNSVASVSSQTVANGGSASFVFNNTPAAAQTAQVNCYFESNRVRDMVLAAHPTYPTIATQTSFPIYTNIADTCNAYYDGASINFFAAGGSCNNTGFATVVHHEYGHHVVNRGGSGQAAYGEGMGDIMGVLMTDEAQLGVGFFAGNCSSGLRNAANSCQYSATSCSSCGSAIHSCGQLISGVVWDLRNSLRAAYPSDYRTRLARLAVNSVPLHAGQSDIASDISADFLTIDDAVSNGGNNDIRDGTPNYNLITQAFAAHGLSSPSIALFLFEFPNAFPTSVDPAGGQTYDLEIRPVAGQVQPGSEKMWIREGTSGPFTAVALQKQSGNTYRATFPASTCRSVLEYYFEATNTGGIVVRSPSTAPGELLTVTSQISASMSLADDFDGTTTVFTTAGNRGPSSGGFLRTGPSTSNSCNGPTILAGKAWVTGSLSSTCNDIDGGFTEMVSPVFDASGAESLFFGISTYLSNDTGAFPGEDPLTILASNDGGTTWVVVDAIYQSHGWTPRTYQLQQFVSPSSSMRVKVRAEDAGAGDSQVKAAVDNVAVEAVVCSSGPFGDLDGDRLVGAGDAALLLLDFGPCPGCASDLDGTGVVDGGDLALLLLSFTE